MAHFARIDKQTKKVLHVHVVDNVNCINPETKQEDEFTGINYLKTVHKDQTWIENVEFVQTSYTGKSRKNFAGIGFIYDESRGAFIAPKPDQLPASLIKDPGEFVLNEETCKWEFSGTLKTVI